MCVKEHGDSSWEVKWPPRETENNAYTKLWGDKQSIMVCYGIFWSGQ